MSGRSMEPCWEELESEDLDAFDRPTGRELMASTFDSGRRRLVVFGGSCGDETYGDTWER